LELADTRLKSQPSKPEGWFLRVFFKTWREKSGNTENRTPGLEVVPKRGLGDDGSYLTIPADIHNAVIELSPEERLGNKVSEAVRRYGEARNHPA